VSLFRRKKMGREGCGGGVKLEELGIIVADIFGPKKLKKKAHV
jgi:hypothetical protein